ncbi:MAG: aminodeoxychorismate synthase component I, partial [Thermoleophilaceae bacterium]
MNVPSRARLVRVPLEGGPEAAGAALLVRDDSRPFALVGAWAGARALVGSEPLVVAAAEVDPFSLLDVQPSLEGGDQGEGAVGGGWFGFLGYGLGARVETVPPGPPRQVPLPPFALSFYDHLLRLDASGRWWFEALWSDERDAALRQRLELLRRRLAAGVGERPVRVGPLALAPPGAAGHIAAVAACRERIAAGEIFQANLCLRLEGRWSGDPADLFARTAGPLEPRYAAHVGGPWGALCSMSPELFLRRRGRHVLTEPIKGTAPREGVGAEETRRALAASAKDRAENVMIVDLKRNDLGRVCEYGSVAVAELAEPRPAPGVWHLVSTVSGTLRPGVGDGDLLRACFPPGSVTGAPKIRTMRVIAELEATGREAYTGAIGYASPLAGLELNVAIRTLELSGDRIWLGAGGGIVADSDPEAELEECLVKARPVVEA